MLYRQWCNVLHVSWTDLWIWMKNKLPRNSLISKVKCVHPLSEEELWNTRTWCEIFSKLPAGSLKWPSCCLGRFFLVIFTPPMGICTSNSFIYGGMHSLWLRITKFHLLLRQHSHLKCTIAVHSESYFRGWGFLNPYSTLLWLKCARCGQKRKKPRKNSHFLYAVFKVFISFHLKTKYPIKGRGGDELIQKQKDSTSVTNVTQIQRLLFPKKHE